MPNLNFASQVEAWVLESKARMEAVFQDSAEEVIGLAQDYSPFKTGFNAANVVVKIDDPTPPPVSRNEGQGVPAPDITASINGLEVGSVLYGWFSSAYAARLEYGFSGADELGRIVNQPPRAYVRRAVSQWDSIVQANVRRLASQVAFNADATRGGTSSIPVVKSGYTSSGRLGS